MVRAKLFPYLLKKLLTKWAIQLNRWCYITRLTALQKLEQRDRRAERRFYVRDAEIFETFETSSKKWEPLQMNTFIQWGANFVSDDCIVATKTHRKRTKQRW